MPSLSESLKCITLREKIRMGLYLELVGKGYGVKIPKPSLATKTACSRIWSKANPENPLHAISTCCLNYINC